MRNLLFRTILIFLGILGLSVAAEARPIPFMAPVAASPVKGLVTDASGEPLVGVSVALKSNKGATSTDKNGQFELNADNGDVLIFRLAGFKQQELVIDAVRNIRVVLFEQAILGLGAPVKSSVGSRDQSRQTNTDESNDLTPFAVSIIPVQQVANLNGHLDLDQLLYYAEPAFNAPRQTGADLADHVTPNSFRGLGPDQVLILLNGKRYHASANTNVFGTKGRGNTGTEINSIPVISVERIEVLRDGAAAQYGSDAVAGVINIVLKSQTGIQASVVTGVNATGWSPTLNYDGVGKILPNTTDGLTTGANVSYGVQVGKGNITVGLDYLSKAQTYRPNNTRAFPDESYRSHPGNAGVMGLGATINGTLPDSKGNEFYFFGGYSTKETDMSLWDISADDPRRTVPEIFSETFTPNLLSDAHNYTGTIGYKFKAKGWNADLSATSGKNDLHIMMSNTMNPSMLRNSPTEFENGGFNFAQSMVELDLNRKFGNVLNGLNVAFGGSYRTENYEIEAGEEASWRTYPNPPFVVVDPITGNRDTLTKVGTSQGFPGFKPEQALKEGRSVLGGYLDAELSASKNFLLTGALRFENYSDFGNAFGSKLGASWRLNPTFQVRGSLQTGFRAPSLVQVYYRSTINDVDADGNNYERIVFNSKSELTRSVGIPTLKAEKSVNYSAGWVYRPSDKLSFSVDAYQISVKDRIILTGAFFQDDDVLGAALTNQGVIAAQFYTNALDTRSRGLDLDATFSTPFKKGNLAVTLAANFNSMELLDVKTAPNLQRKRDKYISPRELQFLLSSAPSSKGHLLFVYADKKWNFMLRNTYFSQVELIGTNGILGFDPALDNLRLTNELAWRDEVTDFYKPRLITDFSMGYNLNKKVNITLGGNNIFDVYPTIQNSGSTDGGAMWDGVQGGIMGAFFFGKVNFKF